MPDTTIADIIEDYYLNRHKAQSHKLKSVLEHRAMTQHNHASEHWNGQHDPLFPANLVDRINSTLREYEARKKLGEYIDVHNYQFTPQALAHIVDTLHLMGLTSLLVHRVYETVQNKLEFVMVLQKCAPADKGSSAKVATAQTTKMTYILQENRNVHPSWLWKPVTSTCSLKSTLLDPFPPMFEEKLYQQQNAARVPLGTRLDLDHYQTQGRGLGLMASKGQELQAIINTEIVAKLPGIKLELGPDINPSLKGSDVMYFDRLNIKERNKRAKESGVEIAQKVKIDYVHSAGFSFVYSSHFIGRELNFVKHLNAIEDLLVPGGFYTMAVSAHLALLTTKGAKNTRSHTASPASLYNGRFPISGFVSTTLYPKPR